MRANFKSERCALSIRQKNEVLKFESQQAASLESFVNTQPGNQGLKEQTARKVDVDADWLFCTSAQVQRYIIKLTINKKSPRR